MLNNKRPEVIANMTGKKSEWMTEKLWYMQNFAAQSYTEALILRVSNSGVKEHNDKRWPGSNGAYCVWK